MCGKEALNSSRPSGFLEFVLFNKRSATGPEGGDATRATWKSHANMKVKGRKRAERNLPVAKHNR